MGKVVAPVKGWHKLAVQLGISRGKNFAHINKKSLVYLSIVKRLGCTN